MRKLVVVSFVACLIAVDLLAGSTLWLRELHIQEQSRNEALKSQIAGLQSIKSSLLLDINKLESRILILEMRNTKLEKDTCDLEFQIAESYNVGYTEGFNARGFNIRDPTYAEAVNFMALDQTDQHEYDDETYTCWNYVADFKNNAFEVGYRCGDVGIEFPYSAHAIVCFNTTDHGLIFIEPQDDEIVTLTIGQQYWDRSKYEPTYDDTIVRIFIIW